MTIYFLSGLGANYSAFKYLTFPSNVQTVFIDWLAPLKNESLKSYAKRIAEKIDNTQPFILVGLSFGGMLATEVIEFVQPQKTILISSAARRQELPVYYKLAGTLGINKFFPAAVIKKGNRLINWVMADLAWHHILHFLDIGGDSCMNCRHVSTPLAALSFC